MSAKELFLMFVRLLNTSSTALGLSHRTARHAALFAGVSALTLFAISSAVHARALNGGGSGGAVSAPNIASEAATQAAQQAAAAARQTQDSL
ncbi:MAG: hypothetical protein CFE29_26305, partial [Bradyrhizobiaceae bacterium PARB1]